MGRQDEAAAFHRQAAAVQRDLSATWELALELDHLAAAIRQANPEAARTHWIEALTRLTPFTDPRAMAMHARVQRLLAEA